MKLFVSCLVCLAGALLLGACSAATTPPSATVPAPTATLESVPTSTVTPPPTVPPATQTPLPTFTPTVDPLLTPTVTPVQLDPVLDICVPAPVNIELPENWQAFCYTLLYREVDDTLQTVPVTLWRGPLGSGEYEGRIVLLWGYSSLTSGLPAGGERSIFADSLRMLRLVVFSPLCNVGTNPTPQTYTIGNVEATGTTINVINCPDAPDTRGWFAGVVEEGINLSFYMYADPIMPAGHPAERELQQILNTVEFVVDERAISPDELRATEQAILPTIQAQQTAAAGN